MKFDDIIAALPSLTPDQMQELKARLVMLSGSKGAGKLQVDTTDAGELALDALCQWARDAGLEATFPILRKLPEYPSFKDKAGRLLGWLDVVTRNRVEQSAIMRLGFSLLREDIGQQGRSCSTRTIMRELHRVTAVLNGAFPDYREMGILRVVLFGKMETGRELQDARKK
jgi:hypothetical protein